MKRPVPANKALRMINCGPTVLVSCRGLDKSPNIITLSWCMPVSMSPPYLAISVAPNRYSYELLKKGSDFVVNIPTVELLEKVHLCGVLSGRNKDKFDEAKLTQIPAETVNSPLIEECIGHLECTVEWIYPAGDHSLFIGKIVAAGADDEYFDDYWIPEKAKFILHLGDNKYTTPEKRLEVKLDN